MPLYYKQHHRERKSRSHKKIVPHEFWDLNGLGFLSKKKKGWAELVQNWDEMFQEKYSIIVRY